jgi:hypothetical protein
MCVWAHDGIETPAGGLPSTSSLTSVVVAAEPVSSAPMRSIIDVFFNFVGGRYWTHQQHPPRGPPSMSSSTSVVATIGPTDSAPRGPAIDVFFILGGGCNRTRW